jgi:eukaryotic-like serine/threonine-protein kinase
MSIIAGTFIPLEKIAQGGMAEIFLARQTGAGKFSKLVVLKKVFSKFADNPEFRDMFQAEAALCSLMHHPNIVNVYSSGYSEKHLYMSMEYISGLSLKDLIKKTTSESKKLATPMLLHIVQQVAAGLDYIHKLKDPESQSPLGLIHRDISPQNIMMSFKGEIKLIDFGIAKTSSTLTDETQNGVIKGNFAYMSPEQARSETLSPLTDIYSLGVVLYEAITGKRPFNGANPIDLLKAIDKGVFDKPSKIVDTTEPFVENLVIRMMSSDSVHRPSAGVLCDLIQRELSSKYPKFSATEFAKAMTASFKKDLEKDQLRISTLLKQSSEQAGVAAAKIQHSMRSEQTQVSKRVVLDDVNPIEDPAETPKNVTSSSTISTRSTLSQLASTAHWKNDSQVVAKRIVEAKRQHMKAAAFKWAKRAGVVAILAVTIYVAEEHLPAEVQNKLKAKATQLFQKAERSVASIIE